MRSLHSQGRLVAPFPRCLLHWQAPILHSAPSMHCSGGNRRHRRRVCLHLDRGGGGLPKSLSGCLFTELLVCLRGWWSACRAGWSSPCRGPRYHRGLDRYFFKRYQNHPTLNPAPMSQTAPLMYSLLCAERGQCDRGPFDGLRLCDNGSTTAHAAGCGGGGLSTSLSGCLFTELLVYLRGWWSGCRVG